MRKRRWVIGVMTSTRPRPSSRLTRPSSTASRLRMRILVRTPKALTSGRWRFVHRMDIFMYICYSLLINSYLKKKEFISNE